MSSVLPLSSLSFQATVSGSRVLVYGGIGCRVIDNKSGFCLETVLLNDLWEFDLLKWSGSGTPLRILNLSPVLAGLAGPSLIAIPGEDHRYPSKGSNSILSMYIQVCILVYIYIHILCVC